MANESEQTLDFSRLFTESRINSVFEELNRFANPDQFLREFGGLKSLKNLLQDDCIFAALETRYDAAIGLQRSFQGPNEIVNDFIESAIGRDCLHEIITGALRAIPFGFNVTELIYQRLDGSIVLSEALNKSLHDYKLDRRGNIFLTQNLMTESEPEPFAKYVLSRYRADYDFPYGSGVLQRLYYAYKFRCHGWEFYVKFLEKFGHPIIHAKLEEKPAGPGQPNNLQQFAKMLDSVNRPTAIVTGLQTDLNVFSPSSNGQQFKDFVECINKRIQTVILGQTLTSDNSGGGSNALGQVHNLVREDKRRSDIRMIERAVNDVIGFLGVLNDIAEDQLPLFTLEDEKSLNNERATRDTQLTNIGVNFTSKYIQDHYDLNEDDFNLATRSLPGPTGFSHSHMCNKFSDSPAQQDLSDLNSAALEESSDTLDVDELTDLIRSSRSKRDLELKLTTLNSSREATFTDLLTNTLLQARVSGFVDGDTDVRRENGTTTS